MKKKDNSLIFTFLVANQQAIQERNKTRDKILSEEWILKKHETKLSFSFVFIFWSNNN